MRLLLMAGAGGAALAAGLWLLAGVVAVPELDPGPVAFIESGLGGRILIACALIAVGSLIVRHLARNPRGWRIVTGFGVALGVLAGLVWYFAVVAEDPHYPTRDVYVGGMRVVVTVPAIYAAMLLTGGLAWRRALRRAEREALAPAHARRVTSSRAP